MIAPSALDIAARVRSGRAKAEDVIIQTLDRIARAEGVLNAFTAVLGDQAINAARRLDQTVAAGFDPGPLAGVPFAVKNLFDVEGVATLAGSIIRRGAPPAVRDAPLITRLKAAGAILVGALNMDEFAYGFVTENHHYGPTRNPHDARRIAGGSSGGSAAAVAAGLTPLALGSDTNGSVRVPASLCGIYGLKPTYGRLTCEGLFPFAESLDHAGVFARTLEDLAIAYDGLQDPGARDAVFPSLASAARPLRVGVLGGWFAEGAFPEVLESLDIVADALDARRGVEAPGAGAARSAAFCLTAYEGSRLHLADLRRRPEDFDPAVRDRLLAGAALDDDVAALARRYRPVFRDQMRALFKDYDILLAPTVPCTAPLIGQSTMSANGAGVSVRQNLGAYTQPLSFVGLPVLSAPVNRPGRLPVGVQIIAGPWREELIFAAAMRLQSQGVIAAHPPKDIP